MAFRTSSTRRSTAASAVSSQAVVINSGNATVVGTTPTFGVSGSSIKANTVISLNVVTAGQNTATSTTTVSSGPVISNIAYLDANNAVSSQTAVNTTGGNILITGTGFVANSSVYVNNTLVTNTFISSTQVRAVLPATASGNVNLFIFTPTNTGGISPSQVRFSGAPSWTTAAVSFTNSSAGNVSLVASSDSALTYTLQAGSTLPTNVSLLSAGYLTGTPTGYTSTTTFSPVIIATDVEGQATQQTITLTVLAGDTYFPSVALLTKTSSVNAASTKTFVDSSTNNFTVTPTGNPATGTFSPFSQTGWSNYFDGTGDYLSIASNAAFQLGTNSYTFEAWIYPTALGSNNTNNIINIGTYITGLMIRCAAATGIEVYTNNTQRLLTSTGLTQNAWQHIALVRNGSACTFYVNGSSIGTFTDSSSISPATATVLIGMASHNSSEFFNGYISNWRLVNGTAVYTSAFTPPTTPLTAIANTSLLTCQSNRLIDNSTNNFAITKNGDVSVQAFSPFSLSSWTAATNGGSGYFGTGNYLTTTGTAAGTGDLTYECWFYSTSFGSAAQTLFTTRSGNTSDGFQCVLDIGGEFRVGYAGSNFINTSAGFGQLNRWYHVAVTRLSGTMTLWIDGISRGTNSVTTNLTSTNVGIGAGRDSAGINPANGYISGLRFVTGTALYTTAFTPPTTPPTAISGTSLLLNFTNAGIYDAHSSAVLQSVGTVATSTTQTKFATTSITFSGSGSYLLAPTNQLYAFYTGDFTIEAWIYRTDTGVQRAIVDISAGTPSRILLYIQSNNKLTLFDASSVWLASTNTVPANQWVHVAAARSSGVTKLFINGTQEASLADTRNYLIDTNGLFIGRQFGSTTNDFLGYMEDVRITKGFARYTANFTAPTLALQGQ